MRTLNIETPTHGRALVKSGINSATPRVVIVGFHGYGQNAEDMMAELEAIPGAAADGRILVSVQALHRFYAKGEQKIVASWMTRQNREEAIDDNLGYVDRLLNEIGNQFDELIPDFILLGFSQGVAMAYRAALLGRHQVAGIVAVGGDIPPDVKSVPAGRWPRLLIAAGRTDHWFTPDKVAADEAFLQSHGVAHRLLRYDAGHVFTDDVRAAIGAFFTTA
ncbi:MAG: dienelactone hydrolase family protein [Acidobacteriota bacterium]